MEFDSAIGTIEEIGWIALGLIGLLFAILAFRNRIRWGSARRMGVPAIIFSWMGFIYWLVLFEGAYGLVSILLDFPFWIDIVLFLVILALSMTIYFRLLHRKKFKPAIFSAMFLLPLSIPGVHTAAKLIPKAAPAQIVTRTESPRPSVRYPRKVAVAGSGYAVEFPNPQSKGRLGDSLTARRLTAVGYTKATSKLDQVHGIDGVYVRYNDKGSPHEILIVENKVDSGKLAPDQMTNRWIAKKVEDMLAHPDDKVRRTGELIRDNPRVVRRQLWHHDLRSGRTTISSLDGEARISPVRTENFLGNQVRKRCEAQKPTVTCSSADD